MTESGSFKTGVTSTVFLLGHEFRERVGRMLIRIAGQRIQSLELTDRMQPVGNVSARDGPPAFEGTGELGRPQQQDGQRNKNLILARFEQGNQAVEADDLARGQCAVACNQCLETGQPRTRKRLVLETG